MCGCNSIGGGGTQAFVPAQTPLQSPVQSFIGGPTQLPQQFNVNDGSVRDQNRAQMVLQQLRMATQNLQTPEQARAAGYKPNPSAPDHWINDDVFAVRNAYDLSRPATVMFENGRLVGVMLSHDPRKGAPPGWNGWARPGALSTRANPPSAGWISCWAAPPSASAPRSLTCRPA